MKSLRRKRMVSAFLVMCLLAGGPLPAQEEGERKMQPKFKEAPLNMVLKYYSSLTGKTMLTKGDIKAQITLECETRMTKEETLIAIESVLQMHNISLVSLGDKFMKVIQPAQVSQQITKMQMSMPETGFTEEDKLIQQYIQLKHVEISEIQGVLQNIMQPFGKIQPLERANSLLVTATSANLDRIAKLLDVLDQPIINKIETRIYELKYAEAAKIAQRLNELVKQSQEQQNQNTTTPKQTVPNPAIRTPPGVIRPTRANTSAQVHSPQEMTDRGLIHGKVSIVADDRTNIIFVFSRVENFEFFDRIIDVLDRPVDPVITLKVVALQYADAKEIASILNEFIGAASSKDGKPKPADNSGGSQPEDSRSQAIRDFLRDRAATRTEPTGDQKAQIGELSENTKILADERTNSLLLMGRKADILALEEIISKLDIILAQVLIEAVIIEVNLSDKLAYGIEWLQRAMTVYDVETYGPGGGLTVRKPMMSFAGGQLMGESGVFRDASKLTGRGGTTAENDTPLSSGGLTYFFTLNDFNLDAIIAATASSRDARVLQTPLILTTDNTEAKINIGEERPVVTTTSTTSAGEQRSTYEYKNIGITLQVKPRVNPKGFVVMEIHQTADGVGGFETIDGNQVPVITKREMSAEVAVDSHQTIVLGGLVETDKSESTAKIPFIGDIPVLGKLFRTENHDKQRREVIVLMTPYVMMSPAEVEEQTMRLHRNSKSHETEWHKGWTDSPLSRDYKGVDDTITWPEREGEGDEQQPRETHTILRDEEIRWLWRQERQKENPSNRPMLVPRPREKSEAVLLFGEPEESLPSATLRLPESQTAEERATKPKEPATPIIPSEDGPSEVELGVTTEGPVIPVPAKPSKRQVRPADPPVSGIPPAPAMPPLTQPPIPFE